MMLWRFKPKLKKEHDDLPHIAALVIGSFFVYSLKNIAVRKVNYEKTIKKRLLSWAVLESLLPCMFAVVADTDNNRLVINGLAVSPLSIFWITLRAIWHSDTTGKFLIIVIFFTYLFNKFPVACKNIVYKKRKRLHFPVFLLVNWREMMVKDYPIFNEEKIRELLRSGTDLHALTRF